MKLIHHYVLSTLVFFILSAGYSNAENIFLSARGEGLLLKTYEFAPIEYLDSESLDQFLSGLNFPKGDQTNLEKLIEDTYNKALKKFEASKQEEEKRAHQHCQKKGYLRAEFEKWNLYCYRRTEAEVRVHFKSPWGIKYANTISIPPQAEHPKDLVTSDLRTTGRECSTKVDFLEEVIQSINNSIREARKAEGQPSLQGPSKTFFNLKIVFDLSNYNRGSCTNEEMISSETNQER